MITIGSETIATPEGTFDFAILKEDSDKTYYVSSKDLVKTVLTFTYNNNVFTQTIELITIE